MKKYIYDKDGNYIEYVFQGKDVEIKKQYGEDIYINTSFLGEKASIENNVIRESTRLDRINEKIEKLLDGEYIKDNKIFHVVQPSIFYIWDLKISKWSYSKQLEINSLNEELSNLESNLLSKYDELDKSIARKLKTLEKKLDTEIKELIILIDEKYSKLELLNKS